jgi:hypothetical protein
VATANTSVPPAVASAETVAQSVTLMIVRVSPRVIGP